ncbi:MAG TPA: methionine--tRNA ligase [Candidatus Paceibacterota bacterium]|nr:methionine--tRNA ligase [Candidatus Paceibacterota bacterium]
MDSPKPFYVTTTIPYVNAAPHIGFALEIVQADVIARYQRLRGREVFFNFGSDEHGQKIYQKAVEFGKEPQVYVDEYAAKFADLKKQLDLTYNAFVRTTDSHHIVAAQEMWRRCAENVGPEGSDIYKKKYRGLYCIGDEAFVKESDLVNGKCQNHPNMDLIEIEEENYFFRLSRYESYILQYLSDKNVIIPEWRREEAIKFLESGLEDFSISRVKEKMPWGVPVPGDDTQVMYVWFDALTNYISTLGWPEDANGNFKKFWQKGETVQFAGKDQVRFQSIMWQAMLKSAGLPPTGRVFYHGFITSRGQKMSKSLGNVIEPMGIVEEYGTDALRHFLLRHIHPTEDSDVTMERFKEAYNADLANGLGNQAARVMKLAEDNLDGPVALTEESSQLNPTLCYHLDRYDFNAAMAFIWEHLTQADGFIQDKKPFLMVKSDDPAERERGKNIISRLVQHLSMTATNLEPFMPKTAAAIKEAIRTNKKPENLFARRD